MNQSNSFIQGMAADANRLLSDWSLTQIDTTWQHLHGVVAAWKRQHGNRPGDAADWIAWLAGSPALDDLLAEVERIDLGVTGRHHAPLSRLMAVAVVKAVKAGDYITANKAIRAVRDTLNQIKCRVGSKSNDVVTRMISLYLRENRGITNAELERHILDETSDHPLFSTPQPPYIIKYFPHRHAGSSKMLTRIRLQQRIHKVRERLGIAAPKRAAAASKHCGVPSGIKSADKQRQRPILPIGGDI